MENKVKVAIIGFGSRGSTYASMQNIYKDKMQVVAVADIIKQRVDKAKELYNIADDMCFSSAQELLSQPKLADVVCVCTMDRQHMEHVVPAIEKGYHVLLEKPISPEIDECYKLDELVKNSKSKVLVCHVLRYTKFYNAIKNIIKSGGIGEVVSITANENVAFWHQAHSFVRGNWGNSKKSSPMIMQKCSHDMDILTWLMDKKCKSVSSFGSTHLFKSEKAPKGATKFCMDGCEVKENCIFDAEKIYITGEKTGFMHKKTFMADVLCEEPSVEKLYGALKVGPYGRCVYHCDNDVVDHQVVNLLMEDDSTISFTMCAFTEDCYRYIHIMGTSGEIRADMNTNIITHNKFANGSEVIDLNSLDNDLKGHGGGDEGIVGDFLEMIINDDISGDRATTVESSLQSHLIALAAEKSRLNGGKPEIIN